jgi:hypothetical protein
MLTKFEIALVTVAVLGTLTAWLGGPSSSLVGPVHDDRSTACSVPAGAFRGGRPSFSEKKFDQVSRAFHLLS